MKPEATGLADLTGLVVAVDSKVATVTLNRPEQMNAITLEMAESMQSLSAALERLVLSDDVRVVVIRGAGERAFCTGADLKQRRELSEGDLWRHGQLIRDFCMSCFHGTAPVIAAVHGHCLGGGLEIAVACDLRIVAEDAMLAFSEAKIGAFPGAGGAVFTPRLVGPAVAKDILYTGRRLSGTEAAALGLANRAVPRDTVDDAAREVALAIAQSGPLAVRAIKRLIASGAHSGIDDAFALSDALRRPLNSTADYAEGLNAFAERRTPRFEAR